MFIGVFKSQVYVRKLEGGLSSASLAVIASVVVALMSSSAADSATRSCNLRLETVVEKLEQEKQEPQEQLPCLHPPPAVRPGAAPVATASLAPASLPPPRALPLSPILVPQTSCIDGTISGSHIS